MKNTKITNNKPRDKAILIKVTEQEKAEITQAATLAHAGSVSGFVRQLALDKADKLKKEEKGK